MATRPMALALALVRCQDSCHAPAARTCARTTSGRHRETRAPATLQVSRPVLSPARTTRTAWRTMTAVPAVSDSVTRSAPALAQCLLRPLPFSLRGGGDDSGRINVTLSEVSFESDSGYVFNGLIEVRKTPFRSPVYTRNDQFSQDNLGTSIEKEEKQSRFYAG